MGKQARYKTEFLFAGIAWWAILGIIYSVMLASVLKKLQISALQVAVDAFVSNLFLTGCWVLIINNMRYYLPRQEKYWYILIISAALGALSTWLSHLLLSFIFMHDAQYAQALEQTTGFRFGISFLLIACMSIVSLLWYTQKEQKDSDIRNADAETLSKEAELFKLRQQLQPHFLFNSLNSISALIGSQPEQARKMIYQLSDFLRGTLKKEEQQSVSLEEELGYLELYLDIEKMRFGHRLSTIVGCQGNCKEMKLPPLLLQPIVENAIKFGLYDTTEDITICISATAKNNYLEVIVENPFDPETSSPKKGTGFGLSSVQRRLYLLYSRNDLLETKTENNLFITTVKIPQLA